MFNLLVSANSTTWESDQRMKMLPGRFLEYSGDEAAALSINKPETLKVLERIQTLLTYETGTEKPTGEIIRLGQMRDIRVIGGELTFRFTEAGRLPYARLDEFKDRLQIGAWELNRTHWAVKDGDIPQEVFAAIVPTPKKYDVVLSFAGEDRDYVEQVAETLESYGVAVFYDRFEEVTLWGKDLAEHFDSVYRKQGGYCVMFISKSYAEKVWTRHERRSALARALEERREYLLPARFDDTDIPGLRSTIGYVELAKVSPSKLAELILQKLGRR